MSSLIGSQLDQYRIDSLLGEGGMGSVFRGWDTSLSRPVAVKVMHSQFAKQPEFRERFLQEAKAPARLSHPSIVHIYDFGSRQGLLYIVMEFIPGATLSAHLRQAGELERVVHLKETLVVLAQVAGALAYAHRSGVIHRDIKPDNIMLRRLDHPDREGDPPLRATVTDFGLAKLREGGVNTQTGSFLGTLSYMSPEQCFAQPLDGRSDIYSLGVVLYRLTTGRLPLDIQSPTDAILKHQNVTPPPPRRLRPGLPAGVESIIQKAIAKRPEDRYASADELFRDLRGAADRLSDYELSEFAPTEQVISIVTQPRQTGDAEPARPAALDKAAPPPGESTENRIHIMIPDQTTRSIRITSSRLTIGRGEDCEIAIDDPLISRRHARIDSDGRGFSVVDLNSTNGTYLEDVRLLAGVRETWNPDKLLRVGNSWLRLERAALSSPPRPVSFSQPAPAPSPEAGMSPFSSMGGRVSIYLAQKEFVLPPGSDLAIPVLILNQGTIVDHFRLSLRGLPAEWPAATPVERHLMPGARGEITLTLPPPPAHLAAGAYRAELFVAGRATPDEVAVADIHLEVSPRYSGGLSLQPQRVRGLAEGQFTLEAANQGNAEIRLQLSAQDPENACRFTFTPNPVSIPPQQTVQVALRAHSSLKISSWAGKTFVFTATGRADGDVLPPMTAQGAWERVPPEFEIRLQPQNRRSAAPGKYTVELSTFSPDSVEVLLEGSDPGDDCTYQFSPDRIEVSAAQAGRAGLQILPRDKNLSGEVPFTVTARLALAPHLQKQAAGGWEPVPPPIDLPEPVTLADTSSLPEPLRAKKSAPRTGAGCTVLSIGLAVTIAAGLLVGNIVFEQYMREDGAAWATAAAVWLVGLWISIKLFNRARKPPG